MPAFAGLKLTQDEPAFRKFGLAKVSVERGRDRILTDRPGVIGDAGNSGFQGLNMAAQFGPARIVLVGFDLRLDLGMHWHGRHPPGLNNPRETLLVRWRAAFNRAAVTLAALGIDVVVAGELSTLTAYRKLPLQEALHG